MVEYSATVYRRRFALVVHVMSCIATRLGASSAAMQFHVDDEDTPGGSGVQILVG